jgi:hypothetical protein
MNNRKYTQKAASFAAPNTCVFVCTWECVPVINKLQAAAVSGEAYEAHADNKLNTLQIT